MRHVFAVCVFALLLTGGLARASGIDTDQNTNNLPFSINGVQIMDMTASGLTILGSGVLTASSVTAATVNGTATVKGATISATGAISTTAGNITTASGNIVTTSGAVYGYNLVAEGSGTDTPNGTVYTGQVQAIGPLTTTLGNISTTSGNIITVNGFVSIGGVTISAPQATALNTLYNVACPSGQVLTSGGHGTISCVGNVTNPSVPACGGTTPYLSYNGASYQCLAAPAATNVTVNVACPNGQVLTAINGNTPSCLQPPVAGAKPLYAASASYSSYQNFNSGLQNAMNIYNSEGGQASSAYVQSYCMLTDENGDGPAGSGRNITAIMADSACLTPLCMGTFTTQPLLAYNGGTCVAGQGGGCSNGHLHVIVNCLYGGT